jgi:arylsulfatase A-like enzyme
MERLIRRSLILCGLIVLLGAVPRTQQPPPPSAASSRPNVILIMTDDLGYADLGSYGGTDIRTPNLDQLARDGVRLTDAYANGVLCSPTRAALISGRYPQRSAIETALGPEGTRGLAVTATSLPQVLKRSGYRTALVGKWHLGGSVAGANRVGGPRAHGFDYFFGFMGSHVDYWHHNRGPRMQDLWENETQISLDGQYLTTLITQRTIRFIEESAKAGEPFFVDVAYNAPHWPYNRPDRPAPPPGSGAHVLPNAEDPPLRADYGAMVEAADQGVGEMLQAVERLGLTDNTLVIFTNDNGGEWLSNNAPLFHRKLTVWEGGIRVPAIARWPGRIPPGRVSDQVGVTMDLTASILAATGTPVPPDARLEGMDLFPILEGNAPEVERTLFWRTNAYGQTQRAVRSGDWKLVVDGAGAGLAAVMVFNLRTDPGERNDLASRRQDIAKRLRPLLAGWERDVDAEAKLRPK